MSRAVFQITDTAYGGVGQYAMRLNEGLQELGHDSTTVLAEDVPSGSGPGYSIRRGVDRAWRSVLNRITTAPFHSLYRATPPVVIRNVTGNPVFHFHGSSSWIWQGLRPGDFPGVSFYWTVHDLWPLAGGCFVYQGCRGFTGDCSHCPIVRRPFRNLPRWELKKKRALIEALDVRMIANSNWMAERIREAGLADGDIPIVPPIIDDQFFSGRTDSLRRELQIEPGRFVLGLGARALTDAFKGIPEFLQALSSYPDLVRDCTVILAGDGVIEVPAGMDVRFLGKINQASRLAEFYEALDLFVSPSVMETFGMALAEAQATGTPVVAYEAGGVRDSLHPSDGVLVQTGNTSGLIEAVREMKNSSVDQLARSGRLREWTRARFSSEVVSRQQADIYQENE